jgi:hypothetical protein
MQGSSSGFVSALVARSVLVALGFGAVLLAAPPANAEPVAQAPSPDLLLAIKARLQAFETLHGKFEQEKRIAKIKKPLKSRGAFVLKRGQGVIWRTEAPIQSLLVMNRDSVRVIKNDRTVMSISMSEQPGLRLMGKIVFAVFSADVEEIRQSFEIVGGQAAAGQPWQVTLKPRDAGVAKVISRISLSGADHVDALEIVEQNADSTRIRFTDLDSTRPLADEDARLLGPGPSKK